MLFIFGWNHIKVEDYGPVKEEKCPNCHNTEIWQLKKISRYFTLFFIPVFPHDSENLYACPICNYGIKPDKEDSESYKEIALLNTACLENKITEAERMEQLSKILELVQQRQMDRDAEALQNSGKWVSVVAERSTEELQVILEKKRHEYDSAFVIAAEHELKRRADMN